MDDIKAIATGILSTNHWPPHLGLTTDSERIEWLARQVEELADNTKDFDAENDTLSREVETLEDKLRDRDSLIEDLGDCTDCKLCDGHQKDVAK